MDDLGLWMDRWGEAGRENWMAADSGAPFSAYFLDPAVLSLYQIPGGTAFSSDNFYVRAALMPDNTEMLAGSTIPDFIVQQWAAKIADGVLARLYDMPDQPYSSANRASVRLQRYEQHVAAVKVKVAQSFGRTITGSVPVYF
jgi:hypothetical protein